MGAYIYGVCFRLRLSSSSQITTLVFNQLLNHSFNHNFPLTLLRPFKNTSPKPTQTNLQPSKCNSRSSPSLPPWLPLLSLESELSSKYRCQFRILTILERTVTVYACPSSSISAAGYASSTVAAVGTVGSTGVVTSATPTGSPITYAGAGSMNGVSAFGLTVAGVVALVSCL